MLHAQVRQLSPRVTAAWATPTSGYGHVADEQPLPFLTADGLELTPRFGGEPGQPGTERAQLGLPYGVLDQAWPLRQRLFNWPRRRVNLYWRELFRTRTPADGRLLILDQLSFRSTPDGFEGASPILAFRRAISGGPDHLTVVDHLSFRTALRFARFAPVVVPLFDDWGVNQSDARWLDAPGISLVRQGVQCSAAGVSTVWAEVIPEFHVDAGQTVTRRYTYRWALP
ncbi:hypothetical protein GTZ97_02505 [Aquabacterium fontiphilum]|jgi:hypothetical protein|uniref:hypothetical protein n=1 Tax=Aquabacterium fontiphilum TaxID=450365 RepID=UPI001378E8EE|nr:hypothetical protein [Aquabacterium fontiphilum]NBD19545.1 hypothetical protein [Aquabacterium fontiphilum]